MSVAENSELRTEASNERGRKAALTFLPSPTEKRHDGPSFRVYFDLDRSACLPLTHHRRVGDASVVRASFQQNAELCVTTRGPFVLALGPGTGPAGTTAAGRDD